MCSRTVLELAPNQREVLQLLPFLSAHIQSSKGVIHSDIKTNVEWCKEEVLFHFCCWHYFLVEGSVPGMTLTFPNRGG